MYRPRRTTGAPQRTQLQPVKAVVVASIRKFSLERRNAIRGTVAQARRGALGSESIDSIRKNSLEADMAASAALLEAPGGLRGRKVDNLRHSDVPFSHRLKSRSTALETAYACGFLNAWKADSIKAFETIALLGQLTHVPAADAVGALAKAAEAWGASNYLTLKVAFAREFLDLREDDLRVLAGIDRILGTSTSPMLHYSVMEALKPQLSLFSVARRHTNMFNDHIDGDFRRFLSLSNLVPTPISHSDCAAFLLRGVETSLIDTARSLIVLHNLRHHYVDVWNCVTQHLNPDIMESLVSAQRDLSAIPTPEIIAPDDAPPDEPDPEQGRSLQAYRVSVAFLEFPSLCTFRNDLDRVIGHRLVSSFLTKDVAWTGEPYRSLDTIVQPDGLFKVDAHGSDLCDIDTFYRTYLFLRFVQDPSNIGRLSHNDVSYVFDNTMRLDMLLLESELQTMHLNASDDARALIAVLALALYRGKSSDPDIDFDFRASLEDYITANFGSSIPRFIDSLAPNSPQVANYILASLDEVTLQKMYNIIRSPMEAENTRREILISVGMKLNRIEYIIEAEAIETRSKVSKLKSYFDASRMFVDSVAMKRWLSSNPSAFTEQYKEMLPKLTARLAASTSVVSPSGTEAKIDFFELTSTDAYLVEQMAKEAFREFCTNNEFGIESYLGRRIRHNTLQGVMTKSVDAVLQKPDFSPVVAGTPFGAALESWKAGFKVFVERMRKEFLQFRAENRPNALFNSEIDSTETVSKRNLQLLVDTLRVSGPEMLDELIVTFCWQQIAPQLDTASRQIRVKMTQEMMQSVDWSLQRFNGPEELRVKSELEAAVTSVFAQVASWFQVPQTGFVAASISDICNIIDIEHAAPVKTNVLGEEQQTRYFGISVHRIYDCLNVLLGNAFKHGRPGSDVTVLVETAPVQSTNLHVLAITVRSILPEEGGENCIRRVTAALESSETGRDMVTEGYSGIKKVKFITRLNEGAPTVGVEILGDAIEIRFSLKAEAVEEEVSY